MNFSFKKFRVKSSEHIESLWRLRPTRKFSKVSDFPLEQTPRILHPIESGFWSASNSQVWQK